LERFEVANALIAKKASENELMEDFPAKLDEWRVHF
jgi:hypothetical protein